MDSKRFMMIGLFLAATTVALPGLVAMLYGGGTSGFMEWISPLIPAIVISIPILRRFRRRRPGVPLTAFIGILAPPAMYFLGGFLHVKLYPSHGSADSSLANFLWPVIMAFYGLLLSPLWIAWAFYMRSRVPRSP